MSNDFDIDLDGTIDVELELDELEGDWSDAPTYAVGTNVEYGKFLEYGTEKMPPYPFFRPAIREFKANPERFTGKNTGYTGFDEIENVDQLIRAIAAGLARQMERNVSAGSATGRSPGVDPEHPKEQTGNLKADIGFERL